MTRRGSISLLPAALLLAGLAAVTGVAPAAADNVTVSTDAARTGWDANEPALAPSQVTASDFGQQFSAAVDGSVYAQPLVVGSTVVVTTEKANAYGLDAATGAIKWSRNFGGAFQSSSIGCGDLTPDLGSTSTPVYDAASGTVYLTTKLADGATATQPHWYVQAISTTDGSERAGFPILVQGTADNDPAVTFDPFVQQQRPGLLLANGVLYAGFGSHCDIGRWRGWVAAMAVTGTPHIQSMWTSEVGTEDGGGIWQSGGGLVSDGNDANGNPRIFFSTGNGLSPPVGTGTSPPGYLGDAVVRVGLDATGHLKTQDFFAPTNAPLLNQNDTDLGSGGPAALPASFGTASHPHLLAQQGKDGRMFLLDRDNLGGMGQGPGGTDAVVQTAGPFNGVWGHPAVYGGEGGWVYNVENNGPLRAYQHSVTGSGDPALSASGTSAANFGYTSGSPIVTSSAGAGSGLVWVVSSPNGNGANAQLQAYDAVPTAGRLALRWSAPIGTASKFEMPASSGGRIYVGTRDGHLLAFGRPAAVALNAQPVDFGYVPVGATANATMTFTASQTVTVSAAATTTPFTANASGLPRTLNAGDTLAVPVGFSPGATGAASATVTLTTNLGPATADLHGVGTAPGLSASPSPVAFDTVDTGTSRTLTVNITNTGSANETVSATTPAAAPFAVTGLPAAGAVIAPQQGIAVSVTYTPTAARTDSGTFAITSTSGTLTVPLSGTGEVGQGVLTLTPAATDFGSVVLGTSRTVSFDIGNTGNIPITITLAKAPSGVFTSASPLSEGVTIDPGAVIRQQVTFTPAAIGAAAAQYVVNANTGQATQYEALTGTGVTGTALPVPTGPDWTLNGSTIVSNGDLVLTQAVSSQTGSAFTTAAYPSNGLDAHFTAQIGGGTGADGMTFTLLGDTSPATSIGGGGGGLGYGGLAPGIAVTLDTYQNANDPSGNFVGVANGVITIGQNDGLNYVATSTNVGTLTAGTHDVDVNVYAGHVRVTVDGDLKIDATVPVPASVHPGFTAATGGLTDQHLVRNVTITTPGTATDTTPPAVTMAAPVTGATVSGPAVVSAGATDNLSGVASVRFLLDGAPLGAPVTATPYQTSWDTTGVANGTHTLSAIATDNAGNTATSTGVTVTVNNPPPVDASVSVDGHGTVSAPLSTTKPGDLLLAFVDAGGPPGARQTAAVSGGGLTWTLIKRRNTVGGTSEIWQATASTMLNAATIQSKPSKAGYDQSMTVLALSASVGAVNARAGTGTAPSLTVTTTAQGSWVLAVGNDPGGAVARTVPAGQTLLHQWIDTATGNTFWVQLASPALPTGSVATVNDTAPATDPWNLVAVEVRRQPQ